MAEDQEQEPQTESAQPSLPAEGAARSGEAAQPEAAAARPRPGQAPAGPPVGEREPPKPEATALAAVLGDAWSGIPYESKFNFGDLEVSLQPGDVPEACSRCTSDPMLSFDYLMCLSGTDYESYFEVVYHLYSYRYHRRLTIKTRLDYERPSVDSVTSLWPGADWHEREAAEMLGIDYPGHPNLTPLLLDEDTEEKPLRKSHPLVPIYFDRPGVVEGPRDDTA